MSGEVFPSLCANRCSSVGSAPSVCTKILYRDTDVEEDAPLLLPRHRLVRNCTQASSWSAEEEVLLVPLCPVSASRHLRRISSAEDSRAKSCSEASTWERIFWRADGEVALLLPRQESGFDCYERRMFGFVFGFAFGSKLLAKHFCHDPPSADERIVSETARAGAGAGARAGCNACCRNSKKGSSRRWRGAFGIRKTRSLFRVRGGLTTRQHQAAQPHGLRTTYEVVVLGLKKSDAAAGARAAL